MNNRGQTGIIGAIVLFFIFLIVWFVFLGGWVGSIGKMVVQDNAMTGIEAFMFSNLNFFIFIIMILGVLGFMYFNGGRQ